MGKKAFNGIGLQTIVLLMVLLMIINGCALWNRIRGQADTEAPAPEPEPTSLYYDFGDVLIPAELKIDKKESFVYKSPGFSAGVLILKGRLDRNDLIAFFETNMPKDNWRLASYFKSPRTMMLYHKENRWCVINITERDLYQDILAEIWVAPTVDSLAGNSGDAIGSSGLLR